MIIKSVKLDNFGKFEDYALELGPQLNVIYGDNEDGKSTIMAFILMMFYGHGGRSTDLTKNPRRKYRPWNGKEMRGRIFFEHEGKNYRLERTFGSSNTTDEVTLWNEDTSEKVKLSSKSGPGEAFFGVGEEAFSRSVFIGQGGTLLGTSTKKDEITEKLLNLVTTGSEEVNYEEAKNLLQSQEETLVSKSRKNGLLVRAGQLLEDLSEEKRQARIDEEDKAFYQKKVEEKEAQLQEEVNKKKSLDAHYEGFSLFANLKEYQEAISREKRRAALMEALEETKKKLTTPYGNIDRAFVVKGEEKRKAYEGLLSDGRYLKEELQESEDLLAKLTETVPLAVSDETFRDAFRIDKERRIVSGVLSENRDLLRHRRDVYEKEKERKTLRKEFSEAKRNFQLEDLELSNLQRDYDAVEEDFAGKQDALEELTKQKSGLASKAENKSSHLLEKEEDLLTLQKEQEERIRDAREQLEKARKPQIYTEEIPGGRELRKPVLGSAILLTVLVVLLGILVDELIFTGLLVSAVLFVLSFKKTEKRIVQRESINEVLIKDSEERLEKAKGESIRKYAAEEADIRKLKSELEETGREISRLAERLAALQPGFEEVQKRRMELREKLDEKKTQVTRLFGLMEASEAALKRASALLKDDEEQVSEEDILELERKISQQEEELQALKKELEGILEAHSCEDLDAFSGKYYAYKNHRERLERKSEEVENSRRSFGECLERRKDSEEEIRKHFRIYKELETVEEVDDILRALSEVLAEKERLTLQLESAEEHRKDLERRSSIHELEEKLAAQKEKVDALSLEEETDFTDEEEKTRIRKALEEEESIIQEIREEIISLQSEVREKYRRKKNISQIENEMEEARTEYEEMESDHEALKLARETLMGAFARMQSSFGPRVNEKTQKIFQRLTGGKYEEVMVSRDLAISFQDQDSKKMYDWAFLSGGTIDQAYLSLRLAISDLIIQEDITRPLFLDDVFTQYDDKRAREGLQFLHEFSGDRDVPVQSVLFTCHERILGWAKELPDTEVTKLSAFD